MSKKTQVGYYCIRCRKDGFGPDEMTVVSSGAVVCLDCAHNNR